MLECVAPLGNLYRPVVYRFKQICQSREREREREEDFNFLFLKFSED